MIETTELRLELLRIVKDKNGSEVDEIIHNANKLFDWVNYDPSKVEKDVVEDKPTKSATSLDEEDERIIEGVILSNLLNFYKLHGSNEYEVFNYNKLEYSIIPDYWNDIKKSLYKRLIDVINTRYIGNSGFKPVVKTPGDVILAKKLRDAHGEKLEKVMDDYCKGKTNKDKLVVEPVGEIPNTDPNSRDSFESDEEYAKRIKLTDNSKYSEKANKVANFYGLADEIYDVTKPETRWNCLTDPVGEIKSDAISEDEDDLDLPDYTTIFKEALAIQRERESKREEEQALIPKYSEEANKVADFYDMSESRLPEGIILKNNI